LGKARDLRRLQKTVLASRSSSNRTTAWERPDRRRGRGEGDRLRRGEGTEGGPRLSVRRGTSSPSAVCNGNREGRAWGRVSL